MGADGKETEFPPPPPRLSGLVLKDDSTITVKLAQPEADWPLRLGYSAFMPLPADAIKDPKAYGENPVGNGPYKMEKEGAWQHDSQIALVKNPDYKGAREAKNGGVTFKFYTDPAPAYTDIQANNLDVTDVLPTNALKTYTMDFPENNLNKPYAGNSTLNIPGYLPEFQAKRANCAARPSPWRSTATRSPRSSSPAPASRPRTSRPRLLTATTKTLPVPRS